MHEPERDAAWNVTGRAPPEVICSQSAPKRMFGANLQRVNAYCNGITTRILPFSSPEPVVSWSLVGSRSPVGYKLSRVAPGTRMVFFTFRTRGWQFPENVSSFYWSWPRIKFSFATLWAKPFFSKSMKMLLIVKKMYQTNILICLLLQVNWLPLWWMNNTQTRRVRYQSRKLASKSNKVY